MPSYSLRTLEGRLQKVVTQISAEKDAEGKFIWRGDDGLPYYWSDKPERYVFENVETVAEADQVMFLCPICFEKNQGNVGTHGVMVSFAGRNIPDDAGSRGTTGPTRWTASGTNIDDLVLTPSILLHGGCNWHGFVGSSGQQPGHAG